MTSTASSSAKRHSILPPLPASGPKPPVKFSSTLIISDASLAGTYPITIQSETVVHTRARIESTRGPVLIGRRCVIQERSHLGGKPGTKTGIAPPPQVRRTDIQDDATPGSLPSRRGDDNGVVLGDYVTIEVGAMVEGGGTEVGEGSVICVGARIGTGAKIGKHCTITPLSVVAPGASIPDRTVVYADGQHRTDRRIVPDLSAKAQHRQIEILRKLIPNKADKFL